MISVDWQKVTLGEVAEVSWGNTSTTKAAYVEKGYRAYSASGPDGFVDWAEHHEPGVVLSAIGAQCGKTWWADGSWTCIKNTIWFRSRVDHVDSRFLFYATADPDLWPKRGSAQPFISLGDAQKLRLSLPSPEVQRRIVQCLTAFDDLIENNQRRIEILEEMARLIYREWFVHFRFPGHEDVEFVDSDLGPIPNEWAVTSLADHVSLHRTNLRPSDMSDEEFDHYSIPAFDARRLPVAELGSEIGSGKYLVNGPSVLLSKLNPKFPRVWRVDPSRSERRAVASTEFLVLSEPGDWPLEMVFAVVADMDFGQRLAAMAGGTSTSHQRAKPLDVMAAPIVAPPLGLVQSFVDVLRPLRHLADTLLYQNDVLAAARSLLLPRLVSGELDVSELDHDVAPAG